MKKRARKGIFNHQQLQQVSLRRIREPDAVPVGLMDGETLVRLLVENDIGVTRRTHDLFELTEDEPPL